MNKIQDVMILCDDDWDIYKYLCIKIYKNNYKRCIPCLILIFVIVCLNYFLLEYVAHSENLHRNMDISRQNIIKMCKSNIAFADVHLSLNFKSFQMRYLHRPSLKTVQNLCHLCAEWILSKIVYTIFWHHYSPSGQYPFSWNPGTGLSYIVYNTSAEAWVKGITLLDIN